jgi:hypothetical protein
MSIETKEERAKRRLEQAENFVRSLLEKKNLTLSVSVRSREDAEQILQWMYSNNKPMSAELNSISWDQAMVTPEVREAISVISGWVNASGVQQE